MAFLQLTDPTGEPVWVRPEEIVLFGPVINGGGASQKTWFSCRGSDLRIWVLEDINYLLVHTR